MVVTGDVAIERALAGMGQAVDGPPAELALVAGGLPLLNAWKTGAPVLSGNYRRSLHIGGHSFEGGGSDIGGNSPHQIAIGTNIAYGRRLEYGFEGTDSAGRTYHQPPGGYARRALDETRDEVVHETGQAIIALLKAAL